MKALVGQILLGRDILRGHLRGLAAAAVADPLTPPDAEIRRLIAHSAADGASNHADSRMSSLPSKVGVRRLNTEIAWSSARCAVSRSCLDSPAMTCLLP